MPPRTRSDRPGCQALHLLAASAGLMLLYSCASPMGHRSAFSTAGPQMPPPVLDTVLVHELRGSATVQSGAQRLPLKAETEIHENQPVQVGTRSTLRLALGQRALLDLGPGSRFVIHKLPRDGKGEERATWLRLEQGYLRVIWSDDRGDTPMEVSFGRWAARVGAGEHFFDSRSTRASACSSSGTMTLSGVPEWTPKSLSEPCVILEPHHSPIEIALREKDWDTLRTKRRLQPTLARAADQQSKQAVARLDREGMRPVAWKPATAPGAFSADRLVAQPRSATYFPHTPPVIQIPAEPEPAAVEEYAYVPVSPATVVTQPEPVTVISADDVPTVASEPVAEPMQAEAAEALIASAPTAAGESTATPLAPAAPALKWTESLEVDGANLQPVAPAPTATATIDAASVPTTGQAPVQMTAYAPPQESAPMPESAAVAPAPIVEMPGAATGERAEWIVNVATYAAPESAQQHAQQLIAQNFDATVRHETVRGRSSYRVVIEGLTSEAAAQSAVADLGSKWGVRSAWAMRKR
ncbi:MAG: hypothetical protein K0Q76_3766 [Panacagrimonas sp.]|nr:SPOR domain-containing protein [Panacagrimonas sp.]MCC2658658.1 hypothetical protein [Panacagrimonas sp.]